jgi:peptide/nickel transport system ATP-binding protein
VGSEMCIRDSAWGLLTSIPKLTGAANAELLAIPGTPPSLINLPSGCSFSPRCSYKNRAKVDCESVIPELAGVKSNSSHLVSCHISETERVAIFKSEIAPKL